MQENIIFCPSCECEQVVKNGFTHNGSQNFKCKSCGRQFVLDPKNKMIEPKIKFIELPKEPSLNGSISLLKSLESLRN